MNECQDCGWKGPDEELDEIADLHQRVDPGEEMPSGECPECGCLCHEIEEKPPFTYNPDKKADDSPMTNGERASDSSLALQGDTDDASDVVDLISNLGHYCDREGFDFEAILNTAKMHWNTER